jgi:SDR family mycofactocin-dependent oxidoreductase
MTAQTGDTNQFARIDQDQAPFSGRVALITGAARGQGRSHAKELARLGADIAITDLCRDLGSVGYSLATPEDLAETVRLVEEQGRRCVSATVDVRDLEAMLAFVDDARASLGSLDILVANAGISTMGSICSMGATEWSETIDTNLTGVFNAMRACAPHMRRQRWGRMIGISSMMGRSSNPGIPAYVASKWGVIGLCKSVAFELAGFGVTVNAIAPGNVSTPMIHNDVLYRLMRPDLDHPTSEDVAPGMAGLHVQPVPWIEPEEITAAVVYLVSEAARHITGSVIDVDAGASARFTG